MTNAQMVARLVLAAHLLDGFDETPGIRAALGHINDVMEELAGAHDPENYSGTPV